jgi:hypothetical protein
MKGMLKTTNASCEKFDFSAEGRPNAVSFSCARTTKRFLLRTVAAEF